MVGNTVKDMTTNFGKLDKFEGHNFRQWQKKMHFLLTTLKVIYVLTTTMLKLVEDATLEVIRIKAKWENDNYICRGHILNADSSSMKFLVSNFNNYKMIDSRPVMKQYNKLFRILGQYTQHGLKMDESISVSSIIDKLPPSWKEFKHTLKHGKYDLSLVQLGSYLRIEESLRAQDSNKGKGKEFDGPSVNMIEEGIAEVVIRRTQMMVVWERGLRTIPKTKTFKLVEDGSVLYMGDEPFTPVHGKGSVALKFSSGKTVTLFNVLMLEMSKDDLIPAIDENPKNVLLDIGCIFIGYAEHSKAYRLYVIELNNSISINSIIESIDAIFNENCFSSIHRPKDIIPNVQESQMDDHTDDVPSEIPEPQKEEDPKTYNEAMQSRDAAFWKEAIDDEIGFIMENNTWVLSDLPSGFSQKEGIDYFDTYAPVSRITTIRLLLALAAIHNLVIHQMDVKIAFLNGDLDDEVYMKQLEGFVMPCNEHKVYKLVKSLYGLKQATKQWHQKFDEECNFISEELPDIGSFNDIHPHFDDNPLSGSTTYSSNSLLKEFIDELALITYPPDYDDNLQFDIESDLREIEFLLYQGKDFDLKDSIDQTDLANLDAYFADPAPEMFTDEHAPDYSFPLRFDVYPDDFLEIESDADNFYDDPFDSKGEKIKESKLIIDELDLPCDFLPYSEYDSFNSQDFSRDDDLPSPNNEDKVFNPGILIQEKSVKVITRVAQEKKLAISKASLVFEDFDPPFYEHIVFKNVPKSIRLLPFSFENKEKVFKPGIYTSEKVKEKQEKDKIESKSDKNGKRGKARQCQSNHSQ
nr:hypothetical protein [Tanacetum cinerariifolium]